MPKFKGASCQYYVKCHECLQFVSLRNKVESLDNWLECLNCRARIESQSVSDWIAYGQEKHKATNSQSKRKLTVEDYGIDAKQSKLESNINANNAGKKA